MTTAGFPLSGAALCATLLLVTACGGSQDDGAEPAPSSTPPASTAPADPPSSTPSTTALQPDDVPKPQPQQAAATLRYLAGQGAPLLRIHKMAMAWRPTASQAECQQLGDQLDKVGTPDRVVMMIAGVEDEPLQSMLHAETSALGGAVTDCAAGRTPNAPEGLPLPELTRLIEQRLRDLRAAR